MAYILALVPPGRVYRGMYMSEGIYQRQGGDIWAKVNGPNSTTRGPIGTKLNQMLEGNTLLRSFKDIPIGPRNAELGYNM